MNKRILLSIAMLMGIAFTSGAQAFQEGFMLNNYSQIYRYNPALSGDSDFISLFQASIDGRANVGASAFLYPRDGQVVTFLHSSVPAETFASKIQEDNYKTKSLDFNLFSYGFFRGGAMHTLEVNFRGMYAVSVPGSLFMLAKTGTTSPTYDFSKLQAQGDIYAELAYGYSRKVSDVFSFGGRVKLLGGFYRLDYNVTKLSLSVGETQYKADIEAQMDLTNQAFRFGTGEDGYVNFKDIDYRGLIHLPTGGGLALDLGVALTPVEGLTISASVLDLGGIFWYYGNAAKSSGSVTFTGIKDLSIEEISSGGLTAQLDGLKDEFLQQMRLTPADKKLSFKEIPFSANLGVKYSMPFCKALSAGLTGQYYGSRLMPYWEGRFALACNPVDWFDCTANIGKGTYGMVWGAAGSLRIKQFHINFGLQNGFGGTIPDKITDLEPNHEVVTVGMSYDL